MKVYPLHPRDLKYGAIAISVVFAVGIGIGTISDVQNPRGFGWASILFWIKEMAIGYVIHEVTFLVFMVFGWFPKRKTLKGLMPVFSTAFLGIYFCALLRWNPEHSGLEWALLLFTVCAAVCAVIQAFLMPTLVYDHLIERSQQVRLGMLRRGANRTQPNYVLLTEEDGTPLKVLVANISVISVSDHYLDFVFEHQGTFERHTVHGRLKDYEESMAGRLLKINRSTLINPKYIQEYKESEGKGIFLMKGSPEDPFGLSISRKTEILNLLGPLSNLTLQEPGKKKEK